MGSLAWYKHLNRYLPKKKSHSKERHNKTCKFSSPFGKFSASPREKHKGPTVASAVMSLPAMTFFARSVGCKWNGYFVGNYGHLRKYHHRENGVPLGMVPLIINPTYTFYSWYLLGISSFSQWYHDCALSCMIPPIIPMGNWQWLFAISNPVDGADHKWLGPRSHVGKETHNLSWGWWAVFWTWWIIQRGTCWDIG